MNQKLVEKVLKKGIFRSKAEAERSIESILESIIETIIEEKQLIFYKKFSFKIQERKEKVKIPARNVIKFKVSKNILNKI